MGCVPAFISKPASVIFLRKYAVFSQSLSRRSVVELNRSRTAIDAPTIEGASEFEKRYGRDRCLKISIISFLPDVNPPSAPPKAFPSVHVIISILPITL